MNKTIYKDYRDEEKVNGVLETVRWKLASYYGGPKEPGDYLVADGEGNIDTMSCTGDTPGEGLFDMVVNNRVDKAYFSDGEELTNEDLIKLYKSYNVWYEIVEQHYYDTSYELEIKRREDIPKYFMEPKLTGPIDSELDNYGKVYVDVYGELIEENE